MSFKAGKFAVPVGGKLMFDLPGYDEMVRAVNAMALRGLEPDRTLFYDLSPEKARSRRLAVSEPDRMELEKREFLDAVYAAYMKLARDNPRRIVSIYGDRPVEAVEAYLFLSRLLVGGNLDDALDATHHHAVAIGIEVNGFAAVVVDEILVENLPFVHHQRLRVVRIALVEFQGELQEIPLLLFGCYLFDFDHTDGLLLL